MKLNSIAQLCAIILCLGVLPGCGGEKKEKKHHHKNGMKKEMPYKKENQANKKSMNKEYSAEK